jgi:hypothetical protein
MADSSVTGARKRAQQERERVQKLRNSRPPEEIFDDSGHPGTSTAPARGVTDDVIYDYGDADGLMGASFFLPDIFSAIPDLNEDDSKLDDAMKFKFGGASWSGAARRSFFGPNTSRATPEVLQRLHPLDGKTLPDAIRYLKDSALDRPNEFGYFQQQLWDAGYYSHEPDVFGNFDGEFQEALNSLYYDAIVWQGDLTIGDLLQGATGYSDSGNRASGSGRGSGSGSAARTPALNITTEEELSLIIDQVTTSMIGRRLDDDMKAAQIADIQSLLRSDQNAAIAAQTAGNGAEYGVRSPDVLAAEQVTSDPTLRAEYAATQYDQQVSVLRRMNKGQY